MFFIVKVQGNDEKIIKIHNDNIDTIQYWIDEYLESEIKSLTMCPVSKDTRCVSFQIIKNGHLFQLVKTYKKINRGYIYNSSDMLSEIVLELKVIECDDTVFAESLNLTKKTEFWFKFNNDVNGSMIKQLDRESMYNVFVHVLQLTEQKPKKIQEEIQNVLHSSLRTIKRDLYNSTMKRIKRMNKLVSKED